MIGMILVAGFVAAVFHHDIVDPKAMHVVVTGIASRTIVREAVSSGIAGGTTKLGGATKEAMEKELFNWRDVFR